MDDLISLRTDIDQQHYPFALLKKSSHLGLLHVPIGSVFAMDVSFRRMDAIKWICGAVTNFKSEDDPNNLALVIGTSDAKSQLLFRSLWQRELVLPCYRITFEGFTVSSVLVWVRERSDPQPGYPKKYFPGDIMDKWRAAFSIVEHHDFQRLGVSSQHVGACD